MLLPPDLEYWTIEVFGFIPKRYDSTLLATPFPGGAPRQGLVLRDLFTAACQSKPYRFQRVVAAAVRKRGRAPLRAVRFFLFMAVTAIAGALAHLITHEHEVAPMIGASASVSGAMAAAIRFAFQQGSFLSFRRGDADAAAHVPALSLSRALRNPRVLAFLAVWFGVNIIFGIGSIAIGADGESVAWQAHIGGFFAGLLLFSLFDPVPRARATRRKRHPLTCPIVADPPAPCGAARFHPSSRRFQAKARPFRMKNMPRMLDAHEPTRRPTVA